MGFGLSGVLPSGVLPWIHYRYRSQIGKIYSSLKTLTGNICGLLLKNKMGATGVSLSVMKSAYISLIIGPRGLGW